MHPLDAVTEALDWIEEHLFEELRVSEIAGRAPLSPWHFQRVFQAWVGESIGAYIRRRRLARSVHALLETDARILDVALEHGFESQEAYTRAFRNLFGHPPGRFRALGRRPRAGQLEAASRDRMRIGRSLRGSEPRVVDVADLRVVGVEGVFVSSLAGDSDGDVVIPELWDEFGRRGEAIAGRVGRETHAVVRRRDASVRSRDDELIYLAGARVDARAAVPDELEAFDVPPGRYAVFEHVGPPALLAETVAFALLEWLPDSGFEFEERPELETASADRSRATFGLPLRDGGAA